MFKIGDMVRVLPPFDANYPGIYVIESQSPTGAWQIAGGVDFDEIYLDLVVDPGEG